MSQHTEKRLTDLEIQLAHSQHLLEQLNVVVTEQANSLARLTRMIKQLQNRIDELKEVRQDQRDLLDDKPPHY